MDLHGLTLTGLADRIGVSRPYASLVFNGKRIPSRRFVASVQKLNRLREPTPAPISTNRNLSFLHYSTQELEDAILEYAKKLPREENLKKTITLNILGDLVESLKARLQEPSPR